MFRRNAIRIMNQSQNWKIINNPKYFHSSLATITKQAECVNFLMESFDSKADNKINTIFRNLSIKHQPHLYQKYFECLVSKCEEEGNIHCFYDDGKLIGCVLSMPFQSQTYKCSQWQSFMDEIKRMKIEHVEQEMIDIESHFKEHIEDIADENCFEEQFDTHILEYIAIHPNYQNKGVGTRLLSLVSTEYKESDAALILNTSNPRISDLFENKLELKKEQDSQFKDKEMKWFSFPPMLHTYWNY